MRNYLERYREKYRKRVDKSHKKAAPNIDGEFYIILYAFTFPAPIFWIIGITIGYLFGIPVIFSVSVVYYVGSFAMMFYLNRPTRLKNPR